MWRKEEGSKMKGERSAATRTFHAPKKVGRGAGRTALCGTKVGMATAGRAGTMDATKCRGEKRKRATRKANG